MCIIKIVQKNDTFCGCLIWSTQASPFVGVCTSLKTKKVCAPYTLFSFFYFFKIFLKKGMYKTEKI